MPPSTIRPRLFQPLNIIQVLSPEIVLNLHIGKRGRDIEDLFVGELADFTCWVDVEARKEAR